MDGAYYVMIEDEYILLMDTISLMGGVFICRTHLMDLSI